MSDFMLPGEVVTVPVFVVIMGLWVNGALRNVDMKRFMQELESESAVDEEFLAPTPPIAAKFGSVPAPALKLTLHPSRIVLRKGERRNVKVTLTLTNLTDCDLSWSSASPTVSVKKSLPSDTWGIEALSEGFAQITVRSAANPETAAGVFVRVLPNR